MATKWGIVSAGKISNDFALVLNYLPRSEHEIVAVAARSKESAAKFAKEHGVPKAYGSYDMIAKDKDVEIVYVGSINTTHFEICKMLLEAGKHVLCEKPLTMKYSDTEKLITAVKTEIVEIDLPKRRQKIDYIFSCDR